MIRRMDITPDPSANFGLEAMNHNLNMYAMSALLTISTASTTSATLTALQLIGTFVGGMSGIIKLSGSAGSGFTLTTDTAADIISQFGPTVNMDGSFSIVRRFQAAVGQTVTVAGGTGVTITGTATIADGAWRDYLVTVASPTTVTFTNMGGGTT